MWRPDGWDDKLNQVCLDLELEDIYDKGGNLLVGKIAEAGADAMYEALGKVEVYIKTDGKGGFLIDPAYDFKEWKKGKLIFLPDEEVNE